MSDKYHVYMLPGNTSSRDDIKTEKRIGTPIGLVVNRPPNLLPEKTVSTPPPRSEDPKEFSAKDFPILKGFA